MKILLHTDHYVAVHKPSGFHVHPHEDSRHRVHRSKVCLYRVRDMIRRRVYPVHRLDVATSGVLLFALSSEAARVLCEMFEQHQFHKTYEAIVRGYTPKQGSVELPLELDSTGDLVAAHTDYKLLKQLELDEAVGKRFSKARYSWVQAWPKSGRYHQIRRHFNRISHPVIGDREHGDSHHNRFFREKLGIEGLCLKAQVLEFECPWQKQKIKIEACSEEKWKKLEGLFARL